MLDKPARSLRFFLAAALAANCFTPCYTLAYADVSSDGSAGYEQLRENQQECAGDGQAVEGSGHQGVLRGQDLEEAAPLPQLSYCGRPVHPGGAGHALVEASYRLADTLIRFGAAWAYADESHEVESVVPQEEVPDGSAGGGHSDGFSPVVGTVEDSSAANGRTTTSTYDSDLNGKLDEIIELLSVIANLMLVSGGPDDYGVSTYATVQETYLPKLSPIESHTSHINNSLAVNLGTSSASNRLNWSYASKTWNTGKGGISWLLSYIFEWVFDIRNYSGDIKTYTSYIHTKSVEIKSQIESLLSQQKAAFGYGYGGTVVLSKSSPAWNLDKLEQYSHTTTPINGDSSDRSLAVLTATLLNRVLVLRDNSNIMIDLTKSDSALVSKGFSDLLRNTHTTTAIDGDSSDRSLAVLLATLLNRVLVLRDNTNTIVGQNASLSNLVSKGTSDVYSALHTSTPVGGVQNDRSLSVLVATLLNRVLVLRDNSDTALNIHRSTNNLVSKGLSDVLLAIEGIDFSVSFPAVDISETNKLLGRLAADVAGIRDKYVVGDALGDMLVALLGDLQTPATAAALSSIQDAAGKVFPFCIPSVVNMVLFGSVVADPSPPCWEFDIAGSPLVVDFADFEDFAEVCRWTVRLMFTASLLLGSRRFIFGLGCDD